ncbi:MAG: 30S ribosomal protein S20 [Desulfobacteraceae bacterium]
MANHKSAIKRARQNETRRVRNRSYKTRVKNVVKEVRAAAETSPEEARERLSKAVSTIQKTAVKGIIPKNKASRKISRLSRQVNRMS